MSVDLSDSRAAIGEVVAGRYRIVSLLGRGGCGVVYRAEDRKAGTPVALKILLVGDAHHPAARARFEREADLARRLTHPNTVRMLDFGIHEETPFIAWELLRGCGLEEVVLEAPLGAARVARIACEMLGSLAEAHELGIIHRDVKPANVFLCAADGKPEVAKLLDFGIAKLLAPDSQSPHVPLTRRGEVPGTPRYMAPEQLTEATLTPAVDLYAVGLVMAEALTGRRVFDDESGLDVLRRLVSSDPTPIAREVIGSPLGPVIERATQKLAAARYATANEMRAAVERAALGIATTQAVSRVGEVARDTVMPDTEMAPTDRPKSEPTVIDVVAGQPIPQREIQTDRPPARETPPEALPPPRKRRWLVPVVVSVLTVIAAIVVAMLLLLTPGEPESRAATQPTAARSPKSPTSPTSIRALRAPGALVAALGNEGWVAVPVSAPGSTSGVTKVMVTVTKDTRSGVVLLMRYPNELQASSMDRVSAQTDMACKRSGIDVLCASIDDDPRSARELVANLVR